MPPSAKQRAPSAEGALSLSILNDSHTAFVGTGHALSVGTEGFADEAVALYSCIVVRLDGFH